MAEQCIENGGTQNSYIRAFTESRLQQELSDRGQAVPALNRHHNSCSRLWSGSQFRIE